MNKRTIKILEYSMIFSFLFVIYFGYLLYYPFKVLKVAYPQHPILNKQIKAGEKIEMLVDAEHLTDKVKVTVYPQLQGEYLYNFPIREYVTKKGKTRYIRETLIPEGTIPGEYKLVNTSIFHISPVRDITIYTETETFEVLGGDK